MKQRLLTAAEIAGLAARLPRWSVQGGSLARDFKLADFSAAWGLMARVALLAERHDHHPDWSNSYGDVRIALSTHASGGLTQRDIDLAEAIDRVA